MCTHGPIPHPRGFNASDRSYNLKCVISIIRKVYLKNMLRSKGFALPRGVHSLEMREERATLL